MTNDVTTLTLAVDTTDVKTASQTLSQMAVAGDSAAAATTKLEKANAAMVAELKRIGAGVSELVKLTAAEGRAAQAVTLRSKASAAAALASMKASAAIRDEVKAVEKLAPVAHASANELGKLSLTASAIDTSGISRINAELSRAATQAARTASAIGGISGKTVTIQQVSTQAPKQVIASRPSVSTPSVSINSGIATQASSAQAAIDRLTASAKSQSQALSTLNPVVSATASSYRALSSAPIKVEAPIGLGAATSALRAASEQAEKTKVAFSNISFKNVRAPDFKSVNQAASTQSQAIVSKTQESVKASVKVASTVLREEAKAVESIAPAAAVSAGAINKLSQSTASINTSGVEKLTRELSAAATQASRTAKAVDSIHSTSTVSTSSVQQVTRTTSNSESTRVARETQREASRVARETAATQRASERQAATAAAEAKASARTAARSDLDAQNAKTREAAKAARDLAEAQKAQSKAAGNAAFKNTQLGFQLQDFFIQVQAGQSPLTAFIQQGSQLSGTFGGAGNAFRAVLGLLTPLRVAIGATAAAVGAIGFAFYEGSKQSKAFADSIVLTGNFAGQTEDKFNSLAKAIAQTGQVTIASSREAAQAVLSSGQFGPQVFAQATEATALFAEATGQTADEVIKDFARMSGGVAKWAADTNRSIHFLTAAQFDLIKSFEEQGKVVEAQGVVFDALNNRLKQLDPNLGTIERTLRAGKNAWKSFWDAAYDIGRTETIGDKLKKINEDIENADRTKEFTNKVLGRAPGTGSGASDALLQKRSQLTREQFRESEEADRKAVDAGIQQEAIDAGKRNDDRLNKADPARLVKKEKENIERDIKARELAGIVVSDAEKALLRASANTKGGRGSGAGEANQVLRANLDRDLKSIQDILSQERDAFAFNDRFLQGQYQAGKISLQEYYDARRNVSAQGIEAEIATIELENKKLEEFRNKSKDPSERVQASTRIDENSAQIARLRAQGIREQDLLNQEASASFKQLDESVANYNATLEQLLGNEEKAASIRAAIAIQNARVLSSQKGGSVIDIKAYEQALNIQNQFNAVQQRTSVLSAAARTAEETFAEAAEQRGLSLRDTETGVYQIRKAQLDQLGELVKKAQELAEASTNPAIKQFAADLALEYAKAAKAVDPALQRLKQANADLARSISDSITNLPQTFTEAYSRRRQESFDDIKSQKSEYNQRIDQLEQYLAESSDKQDKARLRERIKKLQDERDSTKRESKASSFFKTVGETILAPIGQQVLSTITKVAVSDPLQKMLENSLNSLTTGDGVIGKIFKDAFGVKDDPLATAQTAQAIAVNSTTTALNAFEQALLSASGALPGNVGGGGIAPIFSGDTSENAKGDLGDILGDFGGSVNDVEGGNKDLAKTIPTVTSVLGRLAGVTNSATSALSILPSIISLISSSAGASSASSAGGLFGAIASAFGGGSSTGAASGTFTNELFHDGGIAGQPTTRRTTASNVFAGAVKYHSGGIAGLQPDEVPAILMGGPKGKREEILTAKDPRHRDNLLNPANRPYQRGQHSAGNQQTTNNKNSVINQEFHFNTGGAPVDRRTAQMAGAAVYQQTARANKRYN